MGTWSDEITELHDFFEAYFRGTETSLDRVEAVLAAPFSIVGPDGTESDRASTIAMLRAGHEEVRELDMSTSDHRLLLDSGDALVATYVEHHHLDAGDTRRHSTVVFTRDASTPNGVKWLRVHETWIE
jgi:hypothetical protein